MSSSVPGTRTGTRPVARPGASSRVPLSVVPDRHAAPGRTFVVLLLAVLGAGLVGLLVLNTAMQRAAFTLDGLQSRASALDIRRQVLDLQVDRLGSPEVLGRRADRLGMVPMTTPVFLRLSDGRILGHPEPAVAGVDPLQVVAPARESHPADPSPAGQPRGQQRGQQRGQHPDQHGGHR